LVPQHRPQLGIDGADEVNAALIAFLKENADQAKAFAQ
jgi:hypothetical protein